MPNKSLQDRAMRKTVERVDIGVFGAPMRLISWVKRQKSSWSGWAAMTAGQSAVGIVIALLAGLLLGVPFNAFSAMILVGFALGSAIGGPFSFAAWTIVLIMLTNVFGGILAGAWVGSPAWWHARTAEWSAGGNMPKWLLVGVPVWMLFWVLASRGVSKLSEFLFERLALRVGFRAAQRYTGEEKQVYDDAFEQSDVSQAETRSLLESTGDGTHSIIAGEPSKIDSSQPAVVVREMGGDPDVSAVPLPVTSGDGIDYDSFLETGGDDPDVLKAIGRKPNGLEPVTGTTESVEAAATDAPSAFVVEMEPLNLPSLPKDTSAPLQRVEPPKLDPRQNRALFRRMSQLNLAFQTARREDRDAEFIEKHEEELAVISDEQRMILESMNDTGPLLALISSIQQRRTEDFLVGKADVADVVPGTGAVDAPASPDANGDEDDLPFEIGGFVASETPASIPVEDDDDLIEIEASRPAPTAEEVSLDPDPVVQTEAGDEAVVDESSRPSRRAGIAAMAASFSDVLTPRRVKDAPEAAPSSQVDIAEEEQPSDITSAASDEEAVETVETSDVTEPVGAVLPETSETAPSDVAGPVQTSEMVATTSFGPDLETALVIEPVGPAPSAPVKDERSGFEFKFDVELAASSPTPSAESDNAVDVEEPRGEVSEDADEPEEQMSSQVFNRSLCRQVLGLIVGPLDPRSKADDVSEFERETGVSVLEIMNSRSFDEQVGAADAAAARHAWKDVKQLLSQTPLERLMADFDRVNERGRGMVEQPHTLTSASFHLFETESKRLHRAATASGDDVVLGATADLVSANVALLDTLAGILKARTEAARTMSSARPGGLVRQKIAPGSDETATRGRGLIGSVLGGARTAGTGFLRESPKSKTPGVNDATTEAFSEEGSAELSTEETVMTDTAVDSASEASVAPSPTSLRPGDDGFVSLHPVDSQEYQIEMDMHAAGVASRQRIAAAARERQEHEESERIRLEQEAEAERLRKEGEAAAAREREEQLAEEGRRAEEARRREVEEAEAARRRQEEAAEAERREELARIQREGAEAVRRREEAEAETAQLALERERANAARSREEEAILRQFRDRQRDLEVPDRFRTENVIAHVLALAELRNVRAVFQRSRMNANAHGMSELEMAMRIPAVRSQLQTDAEMMREATGIVTIIASIVDATDPDDADAIRSMLTPDEVPFFSKIVAQVERGRAATSILEKAEASDREIREKAERAAEAAMLETRLNEATAELERVRNDASSTAEQVREANERAQAAERERNVAQLGLETLRKQMAGIIDDDFQKTLDRHARKLDTGVDGFFAFESPDMSSMIIVMTTPATAFPEGLIQRGTKAMPFADFLDFVVSRSKDFSTDHVGVFYTDPQMRALSHGAEGVTMKQVRRSVEDLKSALNGYGISIEGEGE